MLRDYFGTALEDVRSFMLDYVGGKCAGATIFRCRVSTSRRGGDCGRGDARLTHFDLQFEYAGYPLSAGREVLSLTIPIQVPAAGPRSSIGPWTCRSLDALPRGEVASVTNATRRHEMRRVWYATGRACVQRGLPLRRIGPSAHVSPGDFRISLHFHAVLDDSRWIAYW